MRRVVAMCLVFCLVSLGLVLFAQSRPRLAVMEIDSNSRKLSKAMVKNATRYLRSRIEVAGTYVVIDKARQDKALTQQMQKESYGTCIDESCQIELGQALAADTILRSKITEFGGTCTLTASLVNLERRVATGGAEAEFNCTEKGLKEAIDKVVAGLTGRGGAKPSATVAGTARLTGEPGELWAKCLQKDYNACLKLIRLDWVTYDAHAVVEVFRQACDQGDMMGCGHLGLMLKKGFGIDKDYAKAVKLFRRACDGGNMLACFSLGVAYADEDGPLTVDHGHTVRLYRQACDGGVMLSCTNLGYTYFHGRGVSKDHKRAVSLFRQACDGGEMRGCFYLAFLYENGEGSLPQDYQQAVSLYRQACDGGVMACCINLGYMYLDGRGVSKAPERAVSLFRQACDGGVMMGCNNLGDMYSDGTGVSKDHKLAVSLYRQACDGGLMRGCAELGAAYYFGYGVSQNKTTGCSLVKQACDGGYKDSCEFYQKHCQQP